MIDAISDTEALERLKRQIRRLLEIQPRTFAELLHFTGEDGFVLSEALRDMPSVVWIDGVWKAVAP